MWVPTGFEYRRDTLTFLRRFHFSRTFSANFFRRLWVSGKLWSFLTDIQDRCWIWLLPLFVSLFKCLTRSVFFMVFLTFTSGVVARLKCILCSMRRKNAYVNACNRGTLFQPCSHFLLVCTHFSLNRGPVQCEWNGFEPIVIPPETVKVQTNHAQERTRVWYAQRDCGYASVLFQGFALVGSRWFTMIVLFWLYLSTKHWKISSSLIFKSLWNISCNAGDHLDNTKTFRNIFVCSYERDGFRKAYKLLFSVAGNL